MKIITVNIDRINYWLNEHGYSHLNYSNLFKEILLELIVSGDMTRPELVKELNAPRTTVFDQLNKLMKMKWITSYREETKKIGRPNIFFHALINEKGELKK